MTIPTRRQHRPSLPRHERSGKVDLRMVATETWLAFRHLVYRGGRFHCPCCGADFRSFTRGGGSLFPRPTGYCPRCNAKGRHRRVWHHIETEVGVPSAGTRVLHVAPKYCMYRCLRRIEGIDYLSVGLDADPHVRVVADLMSLPLDDASFDLIVCVHVLEHMDDDAAGIAEMFRVLVPGGVAVVNVPVRMGEATLEDPTVTDPQERLERFGERDHRRWYGDVDLVDRLSAAGFEVVVYRADLLTPDLRERNGIPDDEHVFECRKPLTPAGADS